MLYRVMYEHKLTHRLMDWFPPQSTLSPPPPEWCQRLVHSPAEYCVCLAAAALAVSGSAAVLRRVAERLHPGVENLGEGGRLSLDDATLNQG